MAARVSAVSRRAEAPASHRQRLPFGRVLEAVVSADIATEVCPTLPHVPAALFSGLNLTGALPVRRTRFLRINALDMPGLVLSFEFPER